jgi:outer membrane autotransporter protein
MAQAQQVTITTTGANNVSDVAAAAGDLTTAIQNNGNIDSALDAYRNALAGLAPAFKNQIDTNATASGHLTISPGQAAVIFATPGANPGASLTYTVPPSADNGGAVYVDTGGALYIGSDAADDGGATSPVVFSGNVANGVGGAISNDQGAVNIADSSFQRNSAGQSGGAIYNGAGGTVTIADSSFTANSAATAAGAIFNRGGIVAISDASFQGNSAVSAGGAIYNDSGTVTIADSSFENNSAGYGGAIENEAGSTVTIADSSFEVNSANQDGGAIDNDSGTVTIADSSFHGNSAENGFGGAILNVNGTVTITNSSFQDNSAGQHGGAFFNVNGALDLNVSANGTSQFSGNTAGGQSNSIYLWGLGDLSTLAVDIGDGGVLDMRDPMAGGAGLSPNIISGTIGIAQTGMGTWKLGGANLFTSADVNSSTSFTVSGGTLYLYGTGEVPDGTQANPSATVGAGSLELDGASSKFALGSGATLVAGGANSITTDGTIEIADGATIRGGTSADKAPDALVTPGGATSLTLTAGGMNQVALAGTVTVAAIEAGDSFTLEANLADASGSTGGLTKTGAGTVVLTGTNSYSGATTIDAGTLKGGAANAFSQASATVVNTGGTLDLGGFAQAIDSVSLAGGTLQNGALTGAVTSTGGTVTDLGGSASLTTLSGLTTVLGANSYTGPTTVNGGKLVVGDDAHPGASLVSAVTVNGGGTLGGIGTIGGLNVASGGTVAPGNSIGTLTVAGNASFAAGSTYQVEINPAGASDLLAVTGAATLGGGTVALTKAAGLYAPGTRYTILTAGGGVSGAFGGLTQDMPFVDLALGYDPNDVYLDIVRNTVPFPAVGITRNEVATAAAVEALGQGNTVYNAVVGQPTAAGARQAFNALSGEIYASAQGVMLDDSRYIREAVGDRLRQGLAPETGALAALAPTGPALAYAPQPVIKGPLGKDAARVPAVLAPAYALWGEGFGAWGRRGSDGNASGLDTSVGGFVLGADAPVGDQFRVGVAGGYSRTSLDGNNGSSADLDTYYAALYGGGQWGPLGVRLGAAYSWHDLDATRSVVFPGFAETLKGSRDANTTQAFGEIGYRVALGGVALEPFAGLAYVNLETDAFTEQGGAAGLTGLSGSEDVTFTSLGVRAAQRWLVGATTALTLRGTLGWQHAFGDTTPSAAFLFAGGSLPFTVAGVPIAEDALVVKAGADLDIGPAVTLGVAYSAQFAQDAQDQQVKGVLNVKF